MLFGDICKKYNIKFDDISTVKLEEDGHQRPLYVSPDPFFMTVRTDIPTDKYPYMFVWMKDNRFVDIKFNFYCRMGEQYTTN